MPKMLTDITIQNLKPKAERYEVGDAGARCLRVVVQPSGHKSFIVRYTNAAGRRRKLTLSPGISLAAARKLAAEAMFKVANGEDPATAAIAKKRTVRAQAGDTVEVLADRFITEYAKRKTRENSWRGTECCFKNHIKPVWKGRNVRDIVRRDCKDLVENIAKKYPVQANRVHAALSRFFWWLCSEEFIDASPMTSVEPPTKEKARERTLNDNELRQLWQAAEKIGGPEGDCYKLLMLTGLRRSEIARLKWIEVGLNLLGSGSSNVIDLPAERMKGKLPHLVPLSSHAVKLIAAMPRGGDYIYGDSPIRHFERIKPALDAHMNGVPKWRTHDIRRSVASGMARIGVQLAVIEKIMAHRKGSFGGIVGTYQRHTYLPEMKDALEQWGDHVARIVSGKAAGKVLPLRRHKRT